MGFNQVNGFERAFLGLVLISERNVVKAGTKLVFVTSNRSKFDEVASVLAPEIPLLPASVAFIENPDLTIDAIAQSKAVQAFEQLKQPLIVEDTGVFFEAYENFPGPLAKRIFNAVGPEGLLRLLEGKDRSAFFETVIAYTDGETTKTFSGKNTGSISDFVAPLHDRPQFGYERIFIPDGESKILAEFSVSEKNAFSHRAKACRLFKEWFLTKL